jgi:Ca2+-binding RTX toxin-like protein
MTTYTVGIPNPINPSQAGGGLGAETISFTGWTRSDFAGGATFTEYQTDPVTGQLKAARQLTLTFDGQNQITACKHDLFNGTARVPQFQAVELAVPLDSFLLNSNNLRAALGVSGTFIGNNFDNDFQAFIGQNTFYGYGGNDVMRAGNGNGANTFYGGSGSDKMFGAAGADIFMFDTDRSGTALDLAQDNGGIEYDTANFSLLENGINLDLVTGAGVDGSGNRYTLVRIENVVGSQFADVIRAADVTSYILGSTISGLGGNDTVTGGLRDDILNGDDGNDFLSGGGGNDQMFGGAGNDILTGGAGADLLDGGDGQDTADYTNALSGVVVNLSGTGTGGDALGDTYVSIERVNGTRFADTMTGAGGFGSTLLGGGGNDTLYGGTGAFNYLYGGDGVDTLIGGSGRDYLSPGSSTSASGLPDVVDGGSGIDTITYADAIGGMDINLTTGLVRTAGGQRVEATVVNVENAAGGSGNDLITGNFFGNELSGGAGNDVLLPGKAFVKGNQKDLVNGGDGNDTVSFADTRPDSYGGRIGGVSVNLTTGEAIEIYGGPNGSWMSATLISIENATGTSGNDQLSGDTGANVLSGGDGSDGLYGGAGADTLNGDAGNDFLNAGAGADFIYGGAGTDRAEYAGASAGVTVSLASGTASDGDTLSGVEDIFGSAFNDVLSGNTGVNVLSGGGGSDGLYGGAGNDTLNGDDGDDFLNGGLGADKIDGGAGIDRADYVGAAAGVTVNLTSGTASDGDILTGIENLYGSVLNDVLYGSAAANVLYGNSGDDQLFGLLGNDYLSGQAGSDALFCGEGDDLASGGEGNDGLFGEEGADRLYGGNGDDFLSGGDGNDVIWGEAGDDQIVAGAGNDYIVLGAGNDEYTLGLGNDRVRFSYGNGVDVIRDFGDGNDIIDFTGTDMWLGVLQANTVQTNAGVLMSLGSGSILLAGMQLSQIDWAGDFTFAV